MRESSSISGIAAGLQPGQRLTVTADGKTFAAKCRIDSAIEVDYHRHGGILAYVLRQLSVK